MPVLTCHYLCERSHDTLGGPSTAAGGLGKQLILHHSDSAHFRRGRSCIGQVDGLDPKVNLVSHGLVPEELKDNMGVPTPGKLCRSGSGCGCSR